MEAFYFIHSRYLAVTSSSVTDKRASYGRSLTFEFIALCPASCFIVPQYIDSLGYEQTSGKNVYLSQIY